MSEFISTNRGIVAKNGFSGIKSVGFVNREAPYTLSLDEKLSTTISDTIYRFKLVGDASTYDETITSDKNNRTTVYDGKLSLTLQGLDSATRNQIKLLAWSSPKIFLELYNGDILLMGNEFNCDLTGGNIVTGGARADMQGATLEFSSQERIPILFLDSATKTSYETAIYVPTPPAPTP